MQQMTAGAVVVGFSFDAPAALVKMMPIEKYGAETSGEPVGDGDLIVPDSFGLERAEHRTSGAHDVHRMSAARDELENCLQVRRQSAHRAQLGFVFIELGLLGQASVDE